MPRPSHPHCFDRHFVLSPHTTGGDVTQPPGGCSRQNSGGVGSRLANEFSKPRNMRSVTVRLTSLNGSRRNSSVPITSWKFCRANRCDRRCSSLHACASATKRRHVRSEANMEINSCPPGCDAVSFIAFSISTLSFFCTSHSSTLRMEAAGLSETPVTFYQTTRRHIPEDNNLQVLQSFTQLLTATSPLTVPLLGYALTIQGVCIFVLCC
jgi:hypothetical protein